MCCLILAILTYHYMNDRIGGVSGIDHALQVHSVMCVFFAIVHTLKTNCVHWAWDKPYHRTQIDMIKWLPVYVALFLYMIKSGSLSWFIMVFPSTGLYMHFSSQIICFPLFSKCWKMYFLLKQQINRGLFLCNQYLRIKTAAKGNY